MYIPAAQIVRSKGLGIWANGPHVSSNSSDIRANATEWAKYLDLATFTTLFEMHLDDWLNYGMHSPSVGEQIAEVQPSHADSAVNFSERLHKPVDALGGYVLDVPNNNTGNATATVLERCLRLAVQRGIGWLYPTIACKHSNGTHAGSCTYADLPAYWDTLVDVIEKVNHVEEE